jgi:hypothetical protein
MRIWQLRDYLYVKPAESNGSRRTAGVLMFSGPGGPFR